MDSELILKLRLCIFMCEIGVRWMAFERVIYGGNDFPSSFYGKTGLIWFYVGLLPALQHFIRTPWKKRFNLVLRWSPSSFTAFYQNHKNSLEKNVLTREKTV